MNCCTMRVETCEDGKKVLTGVVHYDVHKGTILVLRKVTDDEYRLRAIDKRDGDRSPASLSSFMLVNDEPQTKGKKKAAKRPDKAPWEEEQ